MPATDDPTGGSHLPDLVAFSTQPARVPAPCLALCPGECKRAGRQSARPRGVRGRAGSLSFSQGVHTTDRAYPFIALADDTYLIRLRTLRALRHLELDPLALVEAAIAVLLDR